MVKLFVIAEGAPEQLKRCNRLVLAAAEEAGVPMPVASLVHDRFVAAIAQGLAQADWASFARVSFRDVALKQP